MMSPSLWPLMQVVVGTFISDPGKGLSKPRLEQDTFIGLSPASASGAATSSGTPRPPKLPTPGPVLLL